MSVQNEEIVWGAEAIAKRIGRPVKSVYNALERGKLPGAKKIHGKWAFMPRVFFAAFETEVAA